MKITNSLEYDHDHSVLNKVKNKLYNYLKYSTSPTLPQVQAGVAAQPADIRDPVAGRRRLHLQDSPHGGDSLHHAHARDSG